MNKNHLAAAVLVAGPLLWASAASALPISFGLQEAGVNGGAITTVATGSTGTLVFSGAYGTFTANTLSATGNPPLTLDLLDSNAINVSSSAAGTLNIFVTEQGLTSPQGIASFLSSFTSNLLNGGITSITEQTFVSPTNALYAGTALATHTFSAIGTNVQTTLGPSLSGPLSVTEEFTIVSTGAGNANSTIDLATVPEPASMTLLGGALVGLGWLTRRRRKTA